MKNLIAFIVGFISSFVTVIMITFLLINFEIQPYSEFAMGSSKTDKAFVDAQRILFMNSLIVFPIVSFVTGLIGGIVAKNREYLIGTVCILPILAMLFQSSLYYLLTLIGMVVFVVVGTRTAIFLKSKRNRIN
jgi:hypothetical protein